MNWIQQSFDFAATSISTTLTFKGGNGTGAGLALDNINVAAVPEPAAYFLALAGLSILGGMARRNRI